MLEIIQIFFDIECKVFDFFIICYSLYLIFPSKSKIRHPRIVLVISIIFFSSAFLLIDNIFSINFYHLMTIYALFGVAYGVLCLETKVHAVIVTVLSCTSIVNLVRFMLGPGLFGLFDALKISDVMQTVLKQVTPQIMIFLCSLFIIHYSAASRLKIPAKYSIAMSVLIIMIWFIIIPLNMLEIDRNFSYILVSSVLPLAIILLLNYFFFGYIKDFEEKQEYKSIAQQFDLLERQFQESAELYNSIRNMRHELKNHIFFMNALIHQEKYQELKKYFKKIYRQEYTIDLIETGNNIINALLNQKVEYAKSKGIKINTTAALPDKLYIDESQICVVLSNLIDNAIEACEKMPGSEISLEISQLKSYFFICCQNPVLENVLLMNPQLKTTKKEPNHGIGLQVIRSIVEKNDGIIDFKMSEKIFSVKVILKSK